MGNIKAIETRYKSYRFRSRLEARWAVFFDALGLTWDYEPEGFETDAGWYLPDFFLKELNAWVEVKPQHLNEIEREKAFAVSSHTNAVLFHLNQIPEKGNMGKHCTYVSGVRYVGISMTNSITFEPISWLMETYEECNLLKQGTGDYIKAINWNAHHFPKAKQQHFPNGAMFYHEFSHAPATGSACAAARAARFEHGEAS